MANSKQAEKVKENQNRSKGKKQETRIQGKRIEFTKETTILFGREGSAESQTVNRELEARCSK
ncbi:hypothetical protein CCACVL1_20574 [Corchorus capsularis]|uniref:Uncharacterized protein n=1 Tax=Corchorus capsularis TaxID=210143 RepID=A0A1R3HAI3_COCAP|nr:hypothetical protein CCACVL1_20574 [Corchorus capsularis]